MNSVATYKKPTSTSLGTYQLLPHCWDEFDIYFPYLDTQAMQVAIERYQQHRAHNPNPSSPSPKPATTGVSNALPTPRTPSAPMTQLSTLEHFAHAHTLHRIALTTMQRAVSHNTRHSQNMLHASLSFILLSLRVAPPAPPSPSRHMEIIGGIQLELLLGSNTKFSESDAKEVKRTHIVGLLTEILKDEEYPEFKVFIKESILPSTNALEPQEMVTECLKLLHNSDNRVADCIDAYLPNFSGSSSKNVVAPSTVRYYVAYLSYLRILGGKAERSSTKAS